MADDAYTIDIPGASDIFILPIDALDNIDLKRQRIARMKSAKSPMPGFLQWIPNVINKLDDAQDLLWTGLVLAKPLLKRLPARFVPYLGWVLLANDILNLATMLLGTAASGRPSKVKVRKAFTSLPFSRKNRISKVAGFMGKTRWLPFALQAGQALESLTGYGLRLGALMAASNDLLWAGMRKLQGKKVIFRGPPSLDPAAKAARYFLQPIAQFIDPEILSDHDHELLIAADNIALQFLSDGWDWNKVNSREPALYTTQTPVFLPWEQSSRDALLEEGIDPDANLDSIGRLVYWGRDRISNHTRWTAEDMRPFELDLRDRFQTERGQYLQNVYDEAGGSMLKLINNTEEELEGVMIWWQVILVLAVEYNTFPPAGTPNDLIIPWCSRAMAIGRSVGRDWPNQDDLRTAAEEILGGWEERPPGG